MYRKPHYFLRLSGSITALLALGQPIALNAQERASRDQFECTDWHLDQAALENPWIFDSPQEIEAYNAEQERRRAAGEQLLPIKIASQNVVDTGYGRLVLTGPFTYLFFSKRGDGRYEFLQSTYLELRKADILSTAREVVARHAPQGDCENRIRDDQSYAIRIERNELIVGNSLTYERWKCARILWEDLKTRLFKTVVHQEFGFKPIVDHDEFGVEFRVNITQWHDPKQIRRLSYNHSLRDAVAEPLAQLGYNYDRDFEIGSPHLQSYGFAYGYTVNSRLDVALNPFQACQIFEGIYKNTGVKGASREIAESRYFYDR